MRKGDVLGTIALSQLGSSKRWPEILDLNPGLDPKKLWVGKKILLPTTQAPARSTEGRRLAAADVSNTSNTAYRVH